ncbi:hypothetical protein JCM10450v2_002210 [Rhodotorula kratochvilovae]
MHNRERQDPPALPTLAPAPALPLSRVHRLLRPLRAALAHFEHDLALDRARQSTTTSSTATGRRALPDPDWDSPASSSSNKRRRSSSSRAQQQPAKRAALLSGADTAAATPDSSPFKHAWRRRPGRAATTYGSRRGGSGGASSAGTRAHSGSAEPEREQQEHQRPTQARLTSADLAARLAAPSARLSPPIQQRALAALRAYGNVLEVVSGTSARGVPSLAEIAARTLGWGIEDDVRACLAAAGDSGSGSGTDEEGGAGGAEMDRSASMQELQLEAAQAQDEWYDACPPYAVRWLLAEHATAILVDALDAADAPFAVWECAFDLCLAHGAHAEATRLHSPLLSALLSLPRTPPPPSLLPLLSRAPSPHALLHSALLPTLLRSSFAQRWFFHPALSLSTPVRGVTPRDAALAAGLLRVMADVARAMIRAIRAACAEGGEDVVVDLHSARALAAEVRRRVLSLARAALGGALAAEGEDGEEALNEARGAVDRVLAAGEKPEAEDHDELDDDDDDSVADLRALSAVCDIALALRCPAGVAPLGAVRDDEEEANSEALDAALARFLPALLTSSCNAGERMLDLALDAGAALGETLLSALEGCSAAPVRLREEARARSEMLQAVTSEGEHAEASEDGAETDYDEPIVVRAPPKRPRRREVVHSPAPPAEEASVFDLVGRGTLPSCARTIRAASSTSASSASFHSARSRSRSVTADAPPSSRRSTRATTPSECSAGGGGARETEVLVLLSPTPEPAHAPSEADDLDLLQGAARRRPPSLSLKREGRAAQGARRKKARRWAVEGEESEDELAM